jgi:hypothetical protein
MTRGSNEPRYTDTLPPEAISEALAPTIDALGLRGNCRQLAMEGWTVVENAADPAFNDRLRERILSVTGGKGGNMLLRRDPVFAEAILNEKLMALAEFSVGRGFLISQVAASVRGNGAQSIGLHADQNWMPAPFPAHNLLLTCCWACDGFTRDGGATLIIPGSNTLGRHPNERETRDLLGAVPIECPPGSVAIWDGKLWHSNYPRTIDGERVVCHITYTRLMCRQVEDYGADADDLIGKHGARMSQLLGREDALFGANGFDYSRLVTTFNDAKR